MNEKVKAPKTYKTILIPGEHYRSGRKFTGDEPYAFTAEQVKHWMSYRKVKSTTFQGFKKKKEDGSK